MTIQVEAHDRLKPFERAARIYCKKNGVDPDATRKERHPVIVGMTRDVPHWHEAAERLLDVSLMLSSLREAAEAAGKEKVLQ